MKKEMGKVTGTRGLAGLGKRFGWGVVSSVLFLLMASTVWAVPTVTEIYPPAGSTTAASTRVSATFSEAMDPATITNGNFNVQGFAGYRTVAAGAYHTVALKGDGTVVAWGQNAYGQCYVPGGLSGVASVAAGYWHTVALKSDGTVVAWGDQGDGKCNVPAGLSGVIAVAAGAMHTVALKSDGTVVAWGYNYQGQCNVPANLSGVVAIAAGGSHTVALKSDGTVVAWGDNYYGQCVVPAGLSEVTAVAAGTEHTVALKSDGTVVAWGNNYFGACNVPAGLSGVAAVAAGLEHTVALKSDGTVVVWGLQSDIPAGLSGVIAVTAGECFTVALKNDGTIVAWGNNNYGQCNVPSGLFGVDGTVTYDPGTVTATFTPSALLQGGYTYFATVTTGARSMAGVPVAAEVRWSFKVGDVVPPATTISLDGSLGENGWYWSDVVVTLNTTDNESGVARTEYSLDVGGTWNAYSGPFSVTAEGNTVIDYRSIDNAGNVEPYQWDEVKIDRIAPVVVENTSSPVPANGATNVSVSQTITFTFSENIQEGTNFANIKLYKGKIDPTKEVQITKGVAGNVLSIDPVVDLKSLTTYRIVIPAGSVKDMAGHPLAADYPLYSFDTAQ